MYDPGIRVPTCILLHTRTPQAVRPNSTDLRTVAPPPPGPTRTLPARLSTAGRADGPPDRDPRFQVFPRERAPIDFYALYGLGAAVAGLSLLDRSGRKRGVYSIYQYYILLVMQDP